MSATRRIQIALFALGLGSLAVALWDVKMGGFYFDVGGLRVSSWEVYKPFRLGMIAIVAAVWLNDRAAEPDKTTWHLLPRWTPWIAAAVAIVSVAVAVRFGIFAAGGADAYGYVSQAALWASGRLVAPDPLASVRPVLGQATVPLGYVPARTPDAMAPIYPPGLPLAMALALKIGGESAVYYVVPLLGGLAVWITYALGARVVGPIAGMIAAVLFAFSPIFMFHTLEPMGDVPVTAWWLLAWLLAISPGRWAAAGAGLAVGAAILTRPNLAPLAIVLGMLVAARRPRPSRLALFAAGSLPACLTIGAINAHLYGSPLASGYGPPLGYLYVWDRWRPNLRNYLGWLVDLNTPGLLLAFAAPLVVEQWRTAIAMLAFFLILLASYLFYFIFDTWPFLRFLLPGIPLLFILASGVFVRALERLPASSRSPAVFLLCVLLPIWYVVESDGLTVFTIGRAEHRYSVIGKAIGRTLPQNAVVISVIESGSVRLYSGRPTVRWDYLEPEKLDEAVGTLQRAGYAAYLLLEDWEVPQFRERFGRASRYSELDWPPVLDYRDVAVVRVYGFADRERYRAGERIASERLIYGR